MNQAHPIKDQYRALETIQELDLKIDQVMEKKEALPAELKSLERDVLLAKKDFDDKTKRLEELEKAQRQAQAAIELNEDRMNRANKKLEDVSNSQEFQAANKEIDQLKKHNASLAEQLETGTNDVSAAQADIEASKAKLQAAETARDEVAAQIAGRDAELEADIARLREERKQYIGRVDARYMSLYQRIRSRRGGMGIAHAINGRCNACNMMLPPQSYNEIMKAKDISPCPSCQRLLCLPASGAESGAEAGV